jgi:hypothetical protein
VDKDYWSYGIDILKDIEVPNLHLHQTAQKTWLVRYDVILPFFP